MVENLKFRIEKPNSKTSEYAKNWTEHHPNSKLREINSILNSTKSKQAKELKVLINKREYKQFQEKIWITSFKDLDWKLWPGTFLYFKNYIQKFESTNDVYKDTSKKLKNFKSRDFKDYVHKPGYQELSDTAKIHKASKEYLSKHESMSEAEYNKIFSWKEQLAQWQLGNCYLVSGLFELANTQYFDTLMRTSISRVQFKDWASWYNIRIPLWEPDGRDILIKDSEIKISSIKWNIGYKLLELAYVKNKRKNNKAWNKYAPVNQWEMRSINWWSVENALSTFLGKNNIWFSNFWTLPIWKQWKTLASASNQQKTEITNYLKNFNWKVWNRFTSLVTAPSPKWDSESFNVWWKTFWKGHAYALNSVEKDWSWKITHINVKNPWNNPNKPWGSNLALSLNEFFRAFSYVWVWKIKVDTFLDNKWNSRA